MSQPEEFRDDVYVAEGFGADTLHADPIGHAEFSRTQPAREALGREPFGRDPLHRDLSRDPFARDLAREVTPLRDGMGRDLGARTTGSPLPSGSPLPAGNPLSGGTAAPVQDNHAHRQATPPGRALSIQTTGDDPASTRAMNILKQALPFVKGLLPLLDGTIGAAISNLITARPHTPPAAVDIAPVQNQITELQLQHNELRTTVQEQTTGLKRVEDQLEMVREATDRNTLEQQELIEDLKAMGNKVNLFAVVLSALLLLSVLLNVVLYMHIKRVLP